MTSNPIPAAKTLYVAGVRLMEPVARGTGLLGWLGGLAEKHRWAHWLRSLFAIHDIDALIALDVPWWTYGAIDEAEAFLSRTPGARVFEYGSGASTVWLARRADTVISVEHDRSWHALVGSRLQTPGRSDALTHRLIEPQPVDPQSGTGAETGARLGADQQYLSQKPGHAALSFETYAKSILQEDGVFDLIVIDGRARGACLEHAMTRLAPGGLIVFDNSGRRRYREAIDASGLDARRYRGLTPSLPYPDETTLLKRQTPPSGG